MDFRHIFPGEREDESIYVFARQYYLAFLPWFLIGFALIAMGIFFAIFTPVVFPELVADPVGNNIFVIITSAYFLLILPFLTAAFIDAYYDIHLVTDRRLVDIDQRVLFSREINELALEEVQDVTSSHNGVLGNFFDFGNVTIQTSGTEQLFIFENVRHPGEIRAIILDLADQAKRSIESGEPITPRPRTRVKGVINGAVMHEITPLESMGAVIAPTSAGPERASGVETQEKPVPLPPETKSTEPPKKDGKGNAEDLDIVIDEPNK